MTNVLLDLFCKQGGAAKGYHDAGFKILGVDKDPQPRYPYMFVQADALDFLARNWRHFVAVHTSPPCQLFTKAHKIQNRDHPDLIAPTRKLLRRIGIPYVIENVPGAPLVDPIELCGAMFPGLGTYRHRLFETNWPITALPHPAHVAPIRKMGRQPLPGEFMHVVGNFTDVAAGARAMGIDWMTRDGLREAIPPAYTQFIGTRLMSHLESLALQDEKEAA